MTIYRSPMEKILEQQEENTVITAPRAGEDLFSQDRLHLFVLEGQTEKNFSPRPR